MTSNVERTAELTDFAVTIYSELGERDLLKEAREAEQLAIAEDLAARGKTAITSLLAEGMIVASQAVPYVWVKAGVNHYAQDPTGIDCAKITESALRTTAEVIALSSLYDARAYAWSKQIFAGCACGYDAELSKRYSRRLKGRIPAEEGLALLGVTLANELPHRDSPDWPDLKSITGLMQDAELIDVGIRNGLGNARENTELPADKILDFVAGLARCTATFVDKNRDLVRRKEGPRGIALRWLRSKV